jgi:hypothetical protein
MLHVDLKVSNYFGLYLPRETFLVDEHILLVVTKDLADHRGRNIESAITPLVEVPADSGLMVSLTMCRGVRFIFGEFIVHKVMEKNRR